MHKKFTKLVVVRKSRELMFLPDQLLKLQGFPSCGLDEAIKLQSPYLSGCPLFCIMRNHKMSNIIKSFGKIFFMATPPSSRPFVPAVFFTHCVFFFQIQHWSRWKVTGSSTQMEQLSFVKFQRSTSLRSSRGLELLFVPFVLKWLLFARKWTCKIFKSSLLVCVLPKGRPFLRQPSLFKIRFPLTPSRGL